MSAISSIGGGSATGGTSGFSDLTSEEFIQIMFAELTNQDPFEPADSKAMLDQLASLRAIESDLDMGNRLEALVRQNEFASAATMVGQVIGGINLNGQHVLDLVVSVTNTPDGPVLNLYDGSRVPFAWVDEVLGPLIEAPDDPDDPDDPDAPGDAPDYISGDINGGDGGVDDGGGLEGEEQDRNPLRGAAS